MDRQELIKKYEKFSDKLKVNEEFESWNKNFTEKANKIIIKLLIISTIIAIPSLLSITTGVIITKELFKLGLYGIMGGSIILVDSALIKIALLINKVYLNSSKKKLTIEKNNVLNEIANLNSQKKVVQQTNIKKQTIKSTNSYIYSHSYKKENHNSLNNNSNTLSNNKVKKKIIR